MSVKFLFSFQEMQSFTTSADVERFLLVHGEHVVDVLGSEVDRIESKIKVSRNVQYFMCLILIFLCRNTLQKSDT